MSMRSVGIVYRKELTEALRDRRTIITTFLVPLLLFPLLGTGMIGMTVVLVDKAKNETAKMMIIGGADSRSVVSDLKKLDGVEIVPLDPNWKNQIVDKVVRAAIEIPDGFETDLAQQKSPTVTIHLYEGELKSSISVQKVEKFFDNYRDDLVKTRLIAKNLPVTIIKPFEVKRHDVAPPEKGGAAIFFGGFIAYMVVFLCLNGGMHPAMDLTAGEKERGTMETILSSPVSRAHLVLGKFFLVLTTSLVTAALSVTSMGVSFWLIHILQPAASAAGNDGPNLQMHIGIGAVLSVFLMALPLSVLFSAALLTISLFAKSYKEAQSYIMPLMFLVIIPAVAAMLPGVDLTPKLALIPILNVSLLCKELVIGTYHWNYIAIIFLSTCVYAAAALFIAIKMFQRESVLFRS
jgi:sodium transport system permease protein